MEKKDWNAGFGGSTDNSRRLAHGLPRISKNPGIQMPTIPACACVGRFSFDIRKLLVLEVEVFAGRLRHWMFRNILSMTTMFN